MSTQEEPVPPSGHVPELRFSVDQPAPPRALGEAIRSQVQQTLTPARRLGRTPRVLLSSALVVLVVAGFALSRQAPDHPITSSALLGALAWAAITLCVLLFGFGRFEAYSRSLRIGLAVGVPSLFLIFLTVWANHWFSLSELMAFPGRAVACAVLALVLGGITSAGVFFIWRRTDPFHPGWSGALAGLVGGLAGTLSIGLVCPDREGWHLWLGHGLSVVALVLLGASLGRRVFSP